MSALQSVLFFGVRKLLGGIIGRCDVRTCRLLLLHPHTLKAGNVGVPVWMLVLRVKAGTSC